MADLAQFVDEIKERVDLVEVIEELSDMRFDTHRRGRFVYANHPDSFAVDPDWGIYTYFAKAGSGGHEFETGDVFHYLERYAGKDFMQACEWLSAKYGVRMPEKRHTDPEKAKAQKTKLEMYELAATWFSQQLWAMPEAVEHCHRRGWTDETIKLARLGLARMESIHDLRGTFSQYEVNFNDPATVAVLGKRGGIALWLAENEIQDPSADWIEQDYIPGLAAGLRLIYPHIWRGRVVYFSSRNLEMRDGKLVNRPEKDEHGNHRPKSYNLPRSLVGERMRYYNFCFRQGAENCLVIEGQADCISAAQLGVAGCALAGVAPDESMAKLMQKYKIKRVFMGLDNDKAGQQNQVKAATVFGPMTRLVTWTANKTEDSEVEDGGNE